VKAMILAAGLGTRLRPLTDDRPKALVDVGGRTMLEITLSRLRALGVRDVIINVHYFADMIIDYLKKNDNFGMHIEVSREDVLLDTGGGLKTKLSPPSRCRIARLLVICFSMSSIDFVAVELAEIRRTSWLDHRSRHTR
jgi:bifunctional N-acetylglucosamine-1-phosphate-uridyltransferase/glucosamine-1-phosphate-acetyltransferase GlmU-like protein